ncbi:SMP-30/gluconolactonase/LRE family protein [Allosphingosinicella deserti]|uniref:Calcium-binding protein n=1 Tax=Allosphingosinicella deserti TaxID=2116704 RepID=A0A2P7QZQ7_9SPHN|nr:SMP-30/gluconolactonase/LRE family protein [Sphingomonas deserti]PSJ43433.1 calcium-binding protein [Sphingomonas deserti]
MSRREGPNTILCAGLCEPEGPVALADGSVALVEMGAERASVTLVAADGRRRALASPGGRPTGLAIDGDDHFWVAGGGDCLLRIAPDGRVVMRLDGDGQGPFLYPNDLAFGPDGLLYMSDSGMRRGDLLVGPDLRQDFARADYDGRLFAIDPVRGTVVRRLQTGLRFANGVAFGPDDALYYTETLTGRIYRQEIGLAPEVFAQVSEEDPADRFRGPDGMAFDADGRLFCAIYGEGRVAVVDGSGAVLPAIATNGDRPTNVAFRVRDAELLITEVQFGTIERVAAAAPGLPLHLPSSGR